MPDEEKLKEKKEEDEEEKELGEKMDIDFDLGNEFKDQLIPLALEYYMEVIEEDEDEDDECHSGDGHNHGKDDSDDDDDKGKKKPAKKAGKKGDAAAAGDK